MDVRCLNNLFIYEFEKNIRYKFRNIPLVVSKMISVLNNKLYNVISVISK